MRKSLNNSEKFLSNEDFTTLLQSNSLSKDQYLQISDYVNNHSESLDVAYRKITDEGIEALVKALEKNTSITTFNIAGSKIGDEGVKALAKVLEKNNYLTFLDIAL